MHVSKPTLILITGLPATGKSHLAKLLAERLQLPQYGKDQFKEILFDTLGIGDRPWSRKLGVASITLLFAVVASELAAGKSCIGESNFSPELDTPRVLALQEHYDFQCIQVICQTDGAVLLERFRSRPRHPGHLDALLASELEQTLLNGYSDPMHLPGPIIEVDTTDFAAISYERIVQQLQAFMA